MKTQAVTALVLRPQWFEIGTQNRAQRETRRTPKRLLHRKWTDCPATTTTVSQARTRSRTRCRSTYARAMKAGMEAALGTAQSTFVLCRSRSLFHGRSQLNRLPHRLAKNVPPANRKRCRGLL